VHRPWEKTLVESPDRPSGVPRLTRARCRAEFRASSIESWIVVAMSLRMGSVATSIIRSHCSGLLSRSAKQSGGTPLGPSPELPAPHVAVGHDLTHPPVFIGGTQHIEGLHLPQRTRALKPG